MSRDLKNFWIYELVAVLVVTYKFMTATYLNIVFFCLYHIVTDYIFYLYYIGFIWLVYLMLNSALTFAFSLPVPNFLSIWFLLLNMSLPILLLKSLTLKHPEAGLSSFKPKLESLYWLHSIFIFMFYFFIVSALIRFLFNLPTLPLINLKVLFHPLYCYS